MKRVLQVLRVPSLWQHADLRRVAVGRVVSAVGDEVALVALLVHLFATGSGTSAVSALLLAASVPTVALAPWAGRWVDRGDSRHLLVGAGLLQALACTGLAWALWADSPLWVLLVGVAALQSVQVVAGPAWQVLVPTIVGDEATGRAMGALQSIVLVAGIGGPALGGLVVGLWSPAVALGIDALSFVFLAAVALRIKARRRPSVSERDDPPGLLDGLRSVGSDRLLLPLFGGLMAFIVAGEMTNVVEVFLVQGVLGGTPFAFGVVGAVFAAGAVVGSVIGGRADSDAQRATWAVICAGVMAVGLVLGGMAPSLVVFGLVWAAGGVALGVLNVVVMTLVIIRTVESRRGSVLAAANGLSRGFSLLATLAGGILGAWLGPRLTFVVAGAAALAVTAGMGVMVRRAVQQGAASSCPEDDTAARAEAVH
jgi:MFS family permease